jgi:hypothetical protein
MYLRLRPNRVRQDVHHLRGGWRQTGHRVALNGVPLHGHPATAACGKEIRSLRLFSRGMCAPNDWIIHEMEFLKCTFRLDVQDQQHEATTQLHQLFTMLAVPRGR